MRFANTTLSAIVTSYVTTLGERKYDQIALYFAPNANWWVNGNPACNPDAGDGTVATRLPTLPGLLGRFDNLSFDVLNIVEQDDKVIAETICTGLGPQDLVYVNNITMSFVLNDDGKFTTVREFPDFNELNWVNEWFKEHNTTGTSSRRSDSMGRKWA
ncbi:uncharacterized protein F4822DRAFT_431970 [Hypoxylon trugodes]|uniref:uncharacterized protein n=1 Tax=Hypoxylon trugodes TaxID=326681 RepID=UPI00219C6107|nr:uncharacterized protein F4822DRAFT_431970 [Hypoxylon trugodes]KAI1385119.1 hypothetical protein F4822DRAFT_431970 [Hypoxylon trugodes]